MAKQTPTVDLTGWSSDGPANIERDAPPAVAPKAKPTANRGAKPAAPAAPAAGPFGGEVDLGALRRRRRPQSAQLSHRVAPELKDALDRTARALGVPSVELLEALLAQLDPDSAEGLSAAREMVCTHLLAGLGAIR